ncbi:hypothetical protein F5984_16225 [Rudanella paleaurantiibacter]|uniref:DUF3365 domain-containing protein n=1 Tax=Rudanella paleaurantiibacter TaxID=2614655 RepID=A0A7J5TX19_9BACT|nr:hypothetical protein [Rudanella paleaurantiibacter]KAB7729185.1 hypothetical protein F5984_16225 [Rudanella paleaurantiibacter]
MTITHALRVHAFTLATSVAVSLTLLSCNPDRLKQTEALKQEMADKKIKRVTNADLNERVDAWGKQIAELAQKELEDKLKAGKSADSLCELRQLPKTAALAKRYALEIDLLGPPDIQNPKLAPKEREVLDAYLYNAENKLPQQANIQRIADTLYVFNTAVPAESPICKACFGDQKQPLAVWRLAFTKREIIRRISVKKK